MQLASKFWQPVLVVLLLVVLLLGVSLVGLLPAPSGSQVLAEETEAIGTLSVSGQGRLSVKPDEAVVELGVVTNGKTAKEAQEANNRLMDQVLAALKTVVAEKDLQTSGLRLDPQYDYSEKQPEPRITGYRAENRLQVTVRDVDLVGKVIDLAVSAGINEINYVRFQVAGDEEVRNRALAAAVKDARAQADAVAGALGKQVVDVVRVEVLNTNLPAPLLDGGYAIRTAAQDLQVATPVEPGEMEVEARVQVIYQLN